MRETVLKRRALMVGTAWTVPVLAVAAAAPAHAVTGCPTMSAAEIYVDTTTDRITVTNLSTSDTKVPAGATITWRVTNVSGSRDTVTIGTRTGVTLTPPASVAINNNATATFVFTTNAEMVIGAAVDWLYTSTNWNLRGSVTISFPGTTLSSCPNIVKCVSVAGAATGTTCPTGVTPTARAASTDTLAGQALPRA